MKLKELAAAAQAAAKNTKGKGSGVLVVTVMDAEDIEFAAGGDRDAIVQSLAQVFAQDDSAKELIIDALKLSEKLSDDAQCNCPRCQLRRAFEEVFGEIKPKRKSDPSVN